MSTTFLPNGIEPDIKVQHGHNDKGQRMHYEHCPRCGDSMPVVCYECHWCDLNSETAEARAGKAPAGL